MRNINKVVVSGNLTRDPEIRKTQSGFPIMTFGIAVNDSRKNPKTDQWEDYANFLDCVMLGERAEKIAPMLSKGMKACIEGKLRWSQWDKDGQKRSKVEIMVDQLEFMSREQKPKQPVYEDDYTPFDVPF